MAVIFLSFCPITFFLTVVFLCEYVSLQQEVKLNKNWNATYEDKLKLDLFPNYDQFVRPTQHYNKSTVSFGLNIIHVDVNEPKNTVLLLSEIRMVYRDQKLQWYGLNYGGIPVMKIPCYNIWQPDIILYNSASPMKTFGEVRSLCHVYPMGEVLSVQLTLLEALCEFDFYFWPFDKQKCQLKFVSSSYNDQEVEIEKYDRSGIETEIMVGNAQWKIEDIGATVDKFLNNNSNYSAISYSFTLTRKASLYRLLFITTTMVLTLLTLLPFCLPPYLTEKLFINGITAVMATIFLFYFSQKFPSVGYNVPAIIDFYRTAFFFIGISTITSIVIIRLSKTNPKQPLPPNMRKILYGPIGKYLLKIDQISNTVNKTDEGNASVNNRSSKTKVKMEYEWIMLSVVIDRMLFCLLFLMYIALITRCAT